MDDVTLSQWLREAARNPFAYIYSGMLGLSFVAIWGEWALSKLLRRDLYEAKDSMANMAMYMGHYFINIAYVQFVYVAYTWGWEHRIADVGSGSWHLGYGDLWWEWPLLIVLEDFCFYAFHRSSHRVRLLWASHVNHHSSQRFNLIVGYRQTWTPMVGFVFWMPLVFIGFDPLMVMTAQAFSLFYQSWCHTQLAPRLGPIEWVMNTPSHHRLHHGANDRYVDTNFGGVFIVWDRLFGTFVSEEETVRFGLGDHDLHTYNPLRIAFHEWAAIGRDAARARSVGALWRAVVG